MKLYYNYYEDHIAEITHISIAGIDMCDVGIGCDHMCLLSSSDSRGYSCICKEGYELDIDGQNCTCK